MRLPIGYLWAAAGGGLLALILAYALGFSAGASRAEAQRAAELDRRLADGGPAADPLVQRSGAGGRSEAPQVSEQSSRQRADGSTLPSRTEDANRAAPADGPPRGAGADPRTSGQYYFVVAHAPVEKSRNAMVDFLRANGLEAQVVRDNNGVLRKVIVLPGFPSKEERSSPEIRQLHDRIRSVGFKWARRARENRDFGDAYLELYRP